MRSQYDINNKEKQRIFDVALVLMEEVGFEKLGIRTICEEAGISIGKFYRYFDSKQQLLAYFYRQLEKKFKDDMEVTLEGLDISTQLIKFYTWFAEYIVSFGYEFVLNFFNNQNPILNTHVYNNEIVVITDSLLAKAVQNGYKIPDDRTIRDISNDLCVIIKGIIFDWCVRHGEFDIGKYTKDLLTRCLRGILM